MRCRLPSYQRICVDRRIGICFFDGRRRKVLATCPCQSVGWPRLNVESHRVSCSVQSIDNLTLLTKAGYITTLSLSGYHHLPLLLRHTAAPVYLQPVPVFGVSAVRFIALPYASLVGRAEQIGFFQHFVNKVRLRFCEFSSRKWGHVSTTISLSEEVLPPCTASASTRSVSARSQEWVAVRHKEEEEAEAEAADITKERGRPTMGREPSPKRKNTSSNFTGLPSTTNRQRRLHKSRTRSLHTSNEHLPTDKT